MLETATAVFGVRRLDAAVCLLEKSFRDREPRNRVSGSLAEFVGALGEMKAASSRRTPKFLLCRLVFAVADLDRFG
jgi:hypothetical protein